MKRNKLGYFSFVIFIPTLIVIVLINIMNISIFSKYIHFDSFPLIASILNMAYWIIISVLLTVLIRYNTIRLYEKPMKRFAQATKQVAGGDFTVYVEPVHTVEKYDYLDYMIIDFNKMVEELGSIETLKTEFFSNVSHEIKTPLAIIQNYAELLENENLSEMQRQEYVHNIYESVKRLSNLITNILKLNKLEKQNIALNNVSYDLSEQLCQCILNYENLWDQKNIEIEVDIEDRRMIYLDAELMELVWNNLLSNAIKFTEENGHICIKESIENDRCIVSISDSGCGMDEKTQKHIFEKFYQGDTSHATQGNGLGLALVMRVLHILNGSIQVESQVGIGSTFTVSLPMNQSGVNNYE